MEAKYEKRWKIIILLHLAFLLLYFHETCGITAGHIYDRETAILINLLGAIVAMTGSNTIIYRLPSV